jgi:hypothetical protein
MSNKLTPSARAAQVVSADRASGPVRAMVLSLSVDADGALDLCLDLSVFLKRRHEESNVIEEIPTRFIDLGVRS